VGPSFPTPLDTNLVLVLGSKTDFRLVWGTNVYNKPDLETGVKLVQGWYYLKSEAGIYNIPDTETGTRLIPYFLVRIGGI
jgi:hypothetical protein